MKRQEGAVGFYFTPDLERVALIEKLKPNWQKGLLNGIGGKLEPGESPAQAMKREFMEEAGLLINDFKQFAALRSNIYTVHFFACTGTNVKNVKTLTEEKVDVYSVKLLDPKHCVYHLPWMIAMAQEFLRNGGKTEPYDIYEKRRL